MIEGAYPFIVVVACLLVLSFCSFALQKWMRKASTAEISILPEVVDAADRFARRSFGDGKFDKAFSDLELDYSVKSLKLADRGLERLREDLPDEEDGEKNLSGMESRALAELVICAGSYLGEVIRRKSDVGFSWVPFEAIDDEAKRVFGGQEDLSNFLLLKNNESGVLSLPMNRIGRFLSNGMEDSTYAFAVHELEARG